MTACKITCLSLSAGQLSVVLLQLARFAMEPEFHFPVRLEVTTFLCLSLTIKAQLRICEALRAFNLKQEVYVCFAVTQHN